MSAQILQLGYLAFEVRNVEAWERFATRVLGLGLAEAGRRPNGGMSFRMDSYAQRILVEPGPADDLAFLGWEVEDSAALDEIARRLKGAGVAVRDGDTEGSALRRVDRYIRFEDPAGTPSEIYCGPARAETPFRSTVVESGFVAEDLGLGHIVLSANDQSESADFYTRVLGFRLSDRIVCDFHGYHVDILFFHVNPRHHSLAFGARQGKRLHHVLIEAQDMDEVGLAYDRTLQAGLTVRQTLGRHPNDRMFSFYADTPSGFQFELGWGGRSIDDRTWEPRTYDRISEWGHHPPKLLSPRKG